MGEKFNREMERFLDTHPAPAGVDRKDAMYLQHRMRGLTPSEAYEAAGFRVDKINPMYQAGMAEKRIMHAEWVKDMADSYGLNLPVFFHKMSELLDAQQQKEYKTKDDEIIDGKVRPDYRVRLAATKLLGEMLYITRDMPKESGPQTVNTTVNILQVGEEFKDVQEDDLLTRLQNRLLGVKMKDVVVDTNQYPVEDL